MKFFALLALFVTVSLTQSLQVHHIIELAKQQANSDGKVENAIQQLEVEDKPSDKMQAAFVIGKELIDQLREVKQETVQKMYNAYQTAEVDKDGMGPAATIDKIIELAKNTLTEEQKSNLISRAQRFEKQLAQ